jgi:nucleoid-associated protein YgaU
MKKRLSLKLLVLLFLLIVILTVTCKSSPRAARASGTSANASGSQIAVAPTAQPAVTVSVPAVPSVVPTAASAVSTTASAISTTIQQPVNTTTGNYNRYPSSIILDGAVNYTVRSGDTLANIGKQMYQDGAYYPLIMMVSGIVVDPDLIYPGNNLVIPDLSLNMNDPSARQSINRYFNDIARIEEQRGRHGTAELIRKHTR